MSQVVEHILYGLQEGITEKNSRNIALREETNYILETLYKLDQEDLRYKIVMV